MKEVVVVGAGRAGQARIRAIEAIPGVRLAGVVSRAAGTLGWSEALDRPGLGAVIVSTETSRRDPFVEEALASGRHVLVEFPLAVSSRGVARYRAAAAAAGRVLHVGWIAEFSAAAQAMRALAASAPPARVRLSFSGGAEGWVGEALARGEWALLGTSRLLSLRRWFGPVVVQRVERRWDGSVAALEARLRAGEVEVDFTERRGPGLPRATRWAWWDERDHPITLPEPGPVGGLFQADTEAFLRRWDGGAPEISLDLAEEVAQLVEALGG